MRVFKNEERVFIKKIGESEKNDRGDEDDGGNEDGHREERGNWEKERKRNREEQKYKDEEVEKKKSEKKRGRKRKDETLRGKVTGLETKVKVGTRNNEMKRNLIHDAQTWSQRFSIQKMEKET